MRYPIWMVVGALCAGAASAPAQDEGGPLLEPVELSLQNDSTDDQLIKLARAAKINVMADASDEPRDEKAPGPATVAPLTVSKTQPLVRWLLDIAYANRMTWQRNEGSTIVLWPKRDIVPFTRRIVDKAVAERPQIEAEIMPALRASLDPELVARLDAEPAKWSQAIQQHGLELYGAIVTDSLRTLLQEKHGWDGQNQDFRLQLKDEQIPASLRAQIILYRRLTQALPQHTASPDWLHDEIWRQARLVVQQSAPSTINGKAQPRQWGLSVAAPVGGREVIRSVVTLTTENGGGR